MYGIFIFFNNNCKSDVVVILKAGNLKTRLGTLLILEAGGNIFYLV